VSGVTRSSSKEDNHAQNVTDASAEAVHQTSDDFGVAHIHLEAITRAVFVSTPTANAKENGTGQAKKAHDIVGFSADPSAGEFVAVN
jgi:hypothetical protein